MYAWTITKDNLFDPNWDDRPATGVVGPRSATMTADEIKNHPDGVKFRLFDDDGELYYEGVLVGGDGFEPLDDFGMPNAGCTTVKIKNGRSWEVL